MDETEITNNEYRQFVYWVRDSIARRLLAEAFPDRFAITESKSGEVFDPPHLNWKEKLDWNSKEQDVREALEPMYFPENERYFMRKEIDPRKLYYAYYWFDLQAAAKKEFSDIVVAKDGEIEDMKAEIANRVAEAEESSFEEVVDANAQCFLAPESMKAAFDAALSMKPQTVGDYFRCAYRSLALSYMDATQELEHNIGRTYDSIYIVGGGAKNAFLNSLTEQASGKKVIALPIEATAIGNLKIQMNEK